MQRLLSGFGFSVLMAFAPIGAHALDALPTQPAGVAAVVNDEVITRLDLDQRLDMVIATTGMPNVPEARARLAPQVIRMLVDERLQMQEATRLGITLPESDLQQAVRAIEQQAGRTPGSLEKDMREKGVSLGSFYNQLRAQGVWSQIIGQKVRPRVRVSNEEAQREAARVAASLAAGDGAQELQLMVLTLPVENGAQEPKVKALAQQLAEDVKKGVSLGTLAQQLVNTGGPAPTEGIWVKVSDVDPALATPLKSAKQGEVVGPIRMRAGYQLVQVMGTRTAKENVEEMPVEVLLKQILFALKPDSSKAEVDATLASAREVQRNPGTCASADVAGLNKEDAAAMNMEASFLRTLLQNLPRGIQPMVKSLSVGTISEPFATPDGIQLVVLCERIEMPQPKPTVDEEVRNRIFREKMEREAMKYLRDLRRTALIDIRL
jgi:peptidyl-prolyl cis-trans isomerase SurA